MIGGTAYAAHKAGERSAEASQREYEQEMRIQQLESQQQYAPPPAAAPPAAAPAAGGTDLVAKLGELKQLLDSGVLTQEEFDAAKQKLLAS
jgi:hypothetical protein